MKMNLDNQWEELTRSMEKYAEIKSNQSPNNNLIPYINKPGIAFSFDDSFRVHHWYQYGKDIFGYYDVKVTFNINAFHHFENQREHSQEEIDMLLDLQANGHEMAHHGFKHRNALGYSKEKGLKSWIEDDIKPLLDWMEQQSHSKSHEKFKKPVSFALPYTYYNIDIINELVPAYFKIVRGGLYIESPQSLQHPGFTLSIGIDTVNLQNTEYIKRLIKAANKSGTNLIFMCHSILPDEINWEHFGWGEDSKEAGLYRISPDTLEEIIKEAKENDMEFYTTAEIAGVATFIDESLEKCIRKRIANPTDQWISISELSEIKELDISNMNISNLDGIQYLVNLRKINLKNNNITDFRLLKKIPYLEEINY